jgi:RNA polymerase-binding transcription factor DksA
VDSDDARRLLEGERSRLQDMVRHFDDERLHVDSEEESTGELSHLDQHQAEVASDTFEREKDFSILERIESELDDVERAMRRLEDGTYGTCEACGSSIGDDRLEAIPAARFCVTHQTQVESG